MKRKSLIAAMVASIVMSAAASTASAEPIGSAVRIINTVTGALDQQRRNLASGDNVSQNETIEVASDALGEFKLRDDTKLALGPGSRLVLDRFVYNPTPSTGAVGVNLVKGAFRFITGLSRKGDYQLRTPSAAITVRGTIFDVYVDDAGGTWLLLLEGSVRVCNNANQCTDVSNPCGVLPGTSAKSPPERMNSTLSSVLPATLAARTSRSVVAFRLSAATGSTAAGLCARRNGIHLLADRSG